MFKKDPASAAILAELQDLKREVAELRGEREGQKKSRNLEAEQIELKRELTDLQIEYDREQEKWEREKREVEHMVGLQRKRGEFEVETAERETKLIVREENLTADKARFDDHVAFIEKRFEQQFKSLNKLVEKFLERMPTTTQLLSVGSGNGGGGDD